MMKAPVAEVEEHREQRHGVEVVDNYFWLRDRKDPRVEKYLEQENAYAEAVTAHTEELQQTLYDEILGRIQEDDSSVPVEHGPFLYYGRTEEGKPYAIHCRQPLSIAVQGMRHGMAWRGICMHRKAISLHIFTTCIDSPYIYVQQMYV